MLRLQSRILLVIIAVLFVVGFAVAWADDSPKININTASADELMQLNGIGEKKAALIIEFRETNGLFKRPRDLIKVPGIGPKTFEKNQERIAVK